MTGPKDPGSDDWGFPEVDPAGPASTQLPPPEPEPSPGFDTGSDAWWRAQAQAQRAAAQHDPVVPPAPAVPAPPPQVPELVEPQVLLPELPEPSPLDGDWLPTDLNELRPVEPEPEPVAAVEPEQVAVVASELTDPRGFPPVEDEPIWTGTSYDDEVTRTRLPADPEGVGPLRALAGAALAVAGVALGIGALLLLGDDEPKGTPTVSAPTSSRITTTGPSATATAEPTATPMATATATVPVVTPPSPPPAQAAMLPVSVLNNSKIKGLADRSAARFRAGGWPVALTGNYRGGTIAQTTVYYAPGQQASAERFAAQFSIARVAPRFPGLPTRGMTVVLTRDYA